MEGDGLLLWDVVVDDDLKLHYRAKVIYGMVIMVIVGYSAYHLLIMVKFA